MRRHAVTLRSVAALEIEEDGKPGERWELPRRVILGRGRAAEIRLENPTVSRRHAEVERQGDVYVLRDLGSTNGTWCNDEPVSEPVVLHDGDKVTVGDVVLRFHQR